MEKHDFIYENGQDNVVSVPHADEPLPITETVEPGAVSNGGYDTLWADDHGYANGGAHGGMTAKNTDEPIKRSLSEVKDELAQARSIKSSRNNSSHGHSGKKKASSKKNSRRNVNASYNLSDARSNGEQDMPTDDVPTRNSSQRRLPGLPDAERKSGCRRPSQCVLIVIAVVVLLLVLAVILVAVLVTRICTESFKSYPNKFTLGGQLQEGIDSNEGCASVCLKDPWCGGYDFERVTKTCFKMTGVVGEEFLQDSTTTDHYERTHSCNKPDGTPLLCNMVFLKNGRAEGGVDIGMMPLADCQRRCLEETGCIGIDYNKDSSTCYIHTINDEVEDDTCCESYRKGCERCKYTAQPDSHTPLARPLNHIKTASECGEYCNQEKTCKGFEFQLIPKVCDIISSEGYMIEEKGHIIIYHKEECKKIEEPP